MRIFFVDFFDVDLRPPLLSLEMVDNKASFINDDEDDVIVVFIIVDVC